MRNAKEFDPQVMYDLVVKLGFVAFTDVARLVMAEQGEPDVPEFDEAVAREALARLTPAERATLIGYCTTVFLSGLPRPGLVAELV